MRLVGMWKGSVRSHGTRQRGQRSQLSGLEFGLTMAKMHPLSSAGAKNEQALFQRTCAHFA